MENLDKLIYKLIQLPNETPWVEFKYNNYNPEIIGKNISALSNGAALNDKSFAYMIWGIDENTHEIIGTNKDLQNLKQGNQELYSWLKNLISQNTHFEFYNTNINGKNVGIIIISSASNTPVTFRKIAYIREGSYTKELNKEPAIEKQLWHKLNNSRFEEQFAKQDLELEDAIKLLEISSYFDLSKITIPANTNDIAYYLIEEGIIVKQDNGLYAVTNLGAILLAKNINNFPRISRKAVRIVQYSDTSRLNLKREDTSIKGYAVDIDRIINYIKALIPSDEIITDAVRNTYLAYPILAIREIIANALIHQDFSITGTGPTVEIFSNRIEITNPGLPLIDIKRIIDNPPKSRNEKLASLMRRFGLCEELGSGWDRIILSCEINHLPAPKIDLYEENTKITIFSNITFANISMEDKLYACYFHACIKFVQNEEMTNSSLRERFGLPLKSSATISRLIKEAIKNKLIKPFDPNTAPKYMKYIPIWV